MAEKYDVVRCTSRVEVEYGNVGAGDTFENGAGFGWTNASYTRGWMLLNDTFREKLRNMEPPEQVFANIIAS
ncbi:hypothetical protein H6768_01630 [Candidatus Peribacteria bacterium]|nr:hypothetical protein [Candidatus Peribacteria bacterium]